MVKWDYPYWIKKFRDASTIKEMDRLYGEFLQAGNINLESLTLLKDGQLTRQRILSLKDKLLEQMILQRCRKGRQLHIGFWDARLAFNFGMMGFHIDAVDYYKKAVDLVNIASATLPVELQSRLNFYWGVAEDLSAFGLYDITCCFCLEHVKDPVHVMAENLRHLKPGGYAYFTPPIKHGTDSPSHLHHFMTEKDLRAIIPEEYFVEFHRVKFLENSPYPNCFIMEVRHNSGV